MCVYVCACVLFVVCYWLNIEGHNNNYYYKYLVKNERLSVCTKELNVYRSVQIGAKVRKYFECVHSNFGSSDIP